MFAARSDSDSRKELELKEAAQEAVAAAWRAVYALEMHRAPECIRVLCEGCSEEALHGRVLMLSLLDHFCAELNGSCGPLEWPA
jgi:hypothetical protein